MGYERYPRGRSQDDWNRDTRFGRDEDDAAARDYGAGSNPGAGRDDFGERGYYSRNRMQDFGGRRRRVSQRRGRLWLRQLRRKQLWRPGPGQGARARRPRLWARSRRATIMTSAASSTARATRSARGSATTMPSAAARLDAQHARDRDYHAWRSGQIAALDRDYDEYRRENQQRFSNEFGSWRTERQGQRIVAVQGQRAYGRGRLGRRAYRNGRQGARRPYPADQERPGRRRAASFDPVALDRQRSTTR